MKKSARRMLVFVLAIMMVVSLAACNGGSGSSGQSSSGGGGSTSSGSDSSGAVRDTLKVAVTDDNGTLDAMNVTGQSFMEVVRTFMDVLFEYKPDGSISWGLATSMEAVSDIQYTLKLREGVTFSNGNTFDADDVMFSLELNQIDPRNQLNVKVIDFDKTKKVDDYTIDLWLTHYDVTQFPGFFLVYIYDKESYDAAEIATNPIGTGPYVVTDYVINSYVHVEARDGYWGDAPGIKKIEFLVMNEDSQRVNAVETGAVDMAVIPAKDVQYVESLGTYNVVTTPVVATSTAYLNCSPTGTPLNSVEAREAVMHAIDRDAIRELLYNGTGTIPSWPISDHCVDFEPRFSNMDETYSVGYDPDKARALAEQSGLVGQKLRITTNGAGEYIRTAEIIQNGLEAIGVESEIINYDQGTYIGVVSDPTQFDIAVYYTDAGSGMGVDILAMYPLFFPLGWEGANHDAYMELGQKATGTRDEAARSEMLYELLEMFYIDQPWYELAEMSRTTVYASDISGIEYYVINYVRFNDWSFS